MAPRAACRAMRAVLALAALGLLTLALPTAAADPLVDCGSEEPPAPVGWYACRKVWAQVDAGYCLRADDAAACAQDEALDLSCTLDAPPSRCGNAIVAFGFRRA